MVLNEGFNSIQLITSELRMRYRIDLSLGDGR